MLFHFNILVFDGYLFLASGLILIHFDEAGGRDGEKESCQSKLSFVVVIIFIFRKRFIELIILHFKAVFSRDFIYGSDKKSCNSLLGAYY